MQTFFIYQLTVIILIIVLAEIIIEEINGEGVVNFNCNNGLSF